MIVLNRNVITDDNGRRPDYTGSYTLLDDRGDTMLIHATDITDIAGATLNVVLGLWPLDAAANVAGLTPDDLVHEAESWAAAQALN
jgi:hypothetical protein